MRMVDLECPSCAYKVERLKRASEPFDSSCPWCDTEMREVEVKSISMPPLEPYFDEGIGAMVTGRQHRRRLMRDNGLDFKDHPSPGQLSARKDWANEQRKEMARRGGR